MSDILQEHKVIHGFTLTSEEKLRICAEGDGREFAGVGWDNEDALLAEYDKRGGGIFRTVKNEDGKDALEKIANGTFYDFKRKQPVPATEEKVVKKAQEPKAKGISVTHDGDKQDKKGKGKKAKQEEEE